MSPQVALSEAVAGSHGEAPYVGFKERGWVPGFTFLIDVAAVETALLFGYLARYALSRGVKKLQPTE